MMREPAFRTEQKAGAAGQRHPLPRKLAVVAVDLIEQRINDELVGYSSGTVSYGLGRFRELLRFSVKAGIPVIFVVPDDSYRADLGSTRVVPGLRSSAPGARTVTKGSQSAFLRTGLSGQLDELGADGLVIGGWDIQECVWATIRGALARHYRVITSEQICFSDLLCFEKARRHPGPYKSGPLADMRKEYQRALDFYRTKPGMTYYDGFDGLMAGLERAAGGR